MDQAIQEYYQEYGRTIRNGAVVGAIICDFLNGAGSTENQKLLTYITERAHRTLSQSYFSLVLQSIKAFAKMENVDGRNASAHQKAIKLKTFMEENGIGFSCPLV